MLRVSSWLYGKKPANASTQSLDSLTELKDCMYSSAGCSLLQTPATTPLGMEVAVSMLLTVISSGEVDEAMKAATFILNDDVDSAENGLAKGASTFHNMLIREYGYQLGKGMVAFIRATLGFEQDIMRQASERLNEAETTAASEQHRAQHNVHAPNAFRSEIYSPGTEYALVQAIAQLMSAVVGVLNESLTEGIKAFYRLRKAFVTLDAILKMEEKFMELRDPSRELLPRSNDFKSSADTNAVSSVERDLNRSLSGLNVAPEPASDFSGTSTPSGSNVITHDPDSDIFKNEIDVFVHSGANFCFGILLLFISMVPPAFTRLLSVIGFHGDKQRGLQMLWQASKFHNLVGAMAALALLGYYNGFVRYCDIMPDPTHGDDVEAYPQERLAALLAEMRSRFPNSRLWLLEASRMKGANKDLEGALDLLCTNNKSPLKQVDALCVFEKSLNALFLHKYETCANAFIECVDLNSWSRSLYYYIAGSCHVVLYRQCIVSDPKQAEVHAQKAVEYIRKAPSLAGKKRFMARQLPFDVFVTRKIAKWEARAKEWDVPLVDAIGVDPVEEMSFFWNGHSRMTTGQLEESLARLAWCESDANKTWSREGPEEKAILELLRAAVYRSLHNHEEAKRILKTRVLSHEKSVFKGHLKDEWVLPTAHFEMAANLWMERPTYRTLHGLSDPSEKADNASTGSSSIARKKSSSIEAEQVHECREYLEHAARWERYELDARIGLKVTAAMEAVQKWENTHAAA